MKIPYIEVRFTSLQPRQVESEVMTKNFRDMSNAKAWCEEKWPNGKWDANLRLVDEWACAVILPRELVLDDPDD